MKHIPATESHVNQPTRNSDPQSQTAKNGFAQAGPENNSTVAVAGKRKLDRQLYVLRLDGNKGAFFGDRSIYKIGLWASPELQKQQVQKSLPPGAYQWSIERTTGDSKEAYGDLPTAVNGEYAMKHYLEKHAVWLGGEFYLATNDEINLAWKKAHAT